MGESYCFSSFTARLVADVTEEIHFYCLPSAFFAVFAFLKKFFSNKNEIAVDARADFSGKVKKMQADLVEVGMTIKIFLCCTNRDDNDGK
mgnify:FL=1